MVLWQVGSAATSSHERQPLEAWSQVGPVSGHGTWNSHHQRSSCLHKGNVVPRASVESQQEVKALTAPQAGCLPVGKHPEGKGLPAQREARRIQG